MSRHFFATAKRGNLPAFGVDLQRLVAKSDMIIVVPTSSILMEDMNALHKFLPKVITASLAPEAALIEALDGTPFVHMVSELNEKLSWCIFASGDDETSEVFEAFSKWVRSLSTETSSSEQSKVEFLIGKRDHFIKILPSAVDDDDETVKTATLIEFLDDAESI